MKITYAEKKYANLEFSFSFDKSIYFRGVCTSTKEPGIEQKMRVFFKLHIYMATAS